MIEKPPQRPQSGEVWKLRGVGPVKAVYTGSRFTRITDLDGSNSRLCQSRDLQPLPPPVEPPKPRPRMSSLDEEFLDFSK